MSTKGKKKFYEHFQYMQKEQFTFLKAPRYSIKVHVFGIVQIL